LQRCRLGQERKHPGQVRHSASPRPLSAFWTYGRHPPPAQRVAAEEGSQKDGPVTVPLAQRQLSKSGFGLLEWIWEGASRGVLVYG
jgi:hypothetical protein